MSDQTEVSQALGELLDHVAAALGLHCRVEVVEDDEVVTASLQGGDLGLVIGKHGQTIDAIQYLATSVVHRLFPDTVKVVVVDAAGYRERRRERLESLALSNAEQAASSGSPVDLEPMSAAERKIVHLCLQDVSGVETRSEGDEPNRRRRDRPCPRLIRGSSGGWRS